MLFVILIAGFGLLSAVLQSWSIIYNRKTIGRSKITPSGIIIIFSGLMIFVATILQQCNQERKDKIKEGVARKEQDKRDSILRRNYDSSLLVMKLKFDTSNFKTTAIIADNLGKYGYKFDSTNGSLVKLIKDSSKTKVIVADDPTLIITSFENGKKGLSILENTDSNFKATISLYSLDAASSAFEIKYSFVLLDDTDIFHYLFADFPLAYESRLPKDYGKTTYLAFDSRIKRKMIYLWARGQYKNSDKTKSFLYDEIYFINISSNTWGTMKGQTREKVIAFVNSVELRK